MISRLLFFSVEARWVVVFLTAVVAAYGSYELTRLPLDALPDITNKQVMINYAAPAFGPEDVEKRITFPIEAAISGLAGIESTRSFSRNGYGQVTAIFREEANLYFMRQQVAERLAQAKPNLPPGVEPQLGPVSTGLGEIFMYRRHVRLLAPLAFTPPGMLAAIIARAAPSDLTVTALAQTIPNAWEPIGLTF
jgi:heavy metal efflux system protein